MSRVITFSRVFPSYHPRKGQPTFFVEKIWQSLFNQGKSYYLSTPHLMKEEEIFCNPSHFIYPKNHTIRSGNRWKEGDKFSPRVWSGKPYQSKQITIAPDIEIKKVWNIGMRVRGDFQELYCNDCDLTGTSISQLAANDGLSVEELLSWFNKPFDGQIICWNESVNY